MRQSAVSLLIARLNSASALAALPHPAWMSGSASQRRMRKRSSGVAGRNAMVPLLMSPALRNSRPLEGEGSGVGETHLWQQEMTDASLATSVPEVAHAREHHGESFFVG